VDHREFSIEAEAKESMNRKNYVFVFELVKCISILILCSRNIVLD